MNYLRDYLIYLTSQQVPMPPSWSKSIGLSIDKHAQIETQEQLDLPITGFKLFESTLTRGAVNNRLWSAQPDNWFTYMLQLYLIALRDIENKNGLPYLNLVYKTDASFRRTISYAPLVSGESYSIYCDTCYPVKLAAYFSHTGEALWEKDISSLSSAKPYVITSELTDLVGTPYDPVAEYLELEIETTPNTKVAVLNGIYPRTPRSLLSPPSEGNVKKLVAVSDISEGEDIGRRVLIPSLSQSKAQAASKLLIYLFDLAVTSDSDPKLLETVTSLLPPLADGLKEIAKATPGIYDLDAVPDRRLL